MAEQVITQAQFLALFERLFPAEYMEAMKAGAGPGWELFQAFAAIGQRCSEAAVSADRGLYFSTAPGGAKSSGNVEFYRATATAGAGAVKRGTIVQARGGRDFLVLEDAVFGGADLGPVEVPVEAVAEGEEWNVPGQVITAAGEALPGDIDTVRVWMQDPVHWDPSVQVRNVQPTTGGTTAMVDALAYDRGLLRYTGEPTDKFRLRVRRLPDNGSPGALDRMLHAALDPLGITFDLIEPWEASFQGCYFGDGDSPGAVPSTYGFDPNLFCYNDPRPLVPLNNRYLDENTHRGAVVLVMPILPAFLDRGIAYNDNDSDGWPQHQTAHGWRAWSAYNVPASGNFHALVHGFYNGADYSLRSMYAQLYSAIVSAVAGGAFVREMTEGE